MESITKQNRKVLCIDPEKCTVIIKYIILHSHVDCVSFFARHVMLRFHLRDTSVIFTFPQQNHGLRWNITLKCFVLKHVYWLLYIFINKAHKASLTLKQDFTDLIVQLSKQTKKEEKNISVPKIPKCVGSHTVLVHSSHPFTPTHTWTILEFIHRNVQKHEICCMRPSHHNTRHRGGPLPTCSKHRLCFIESSWQKMTLTRANWTPVFLLQILCCGSVVTQLQRERADKISQGIALAGLWESPRTTFSFRDIPRMQLHLAVQ